MEKPSGATPLPPKELSLFKRIVKYYDQKQYKTGLKFANQILASPKYMEHGETLSMKGILLNCLGKKDEARDFVKRGLRSNIQSFVCWHIYGLIMKADRKYDEAIRCYIQALKLDKHNLQVLRDLSVLQMHTRDLEGCLETRNNLLTQRPTQKASWVGYAIVQHLLGNFETASTVIYEFLKVQKSLEPYNYEHSELLLYYVTILVESGRLEEALGFLVSHSDEIVDKVARLEIHADLLLRLNRYVDAEKDAWQLLERNPDCLEYYDLLYRTKDGITPETKRDILDQCVKKFSMARLPRLLFLETLIGDEFILHADKFMRRNLRKGVPTLFVQVKRFYDCDEKRKALENLYLTYRKNLTERQTLGPVNYGNLKHLDDNTSNIEPPSTSLWLNYLLAQHFNHIGRTEKALMVISTELESNPTIVDLYTLKADIYRDAGDVISASRWMDEAQSLDTADRFINAQCTKYLVQAQRIEDADKMASKFTRGSTTATQYLTEMQCMWFLIENARSYLAMQKYGDALKVCHEIDRAYSNILEDQLDFHSYCLRKGTLRSYVDTIRLENRLREHSAYFDASSLAIEIYLYLHSNPLGDEADDDGSANANLSSAELKKLRNKQRRAELRGGDDNKKKKDQQQQPKRDKNDDPENRPPEVDELVPKKLARPDDALAEATHFLQPLIDLSGKRLETHCLAYEVYERKGKDLLMLRSIRRGLELPGAKDHPWFNSCLCRFLFHLGDLQSRKDGDTTKTMAHEILFEEAVKAFGVTGGNQQPLPTAASFNDDFLKRNQKSFMHVFSATVTNAIIDPKSAAKHLSQLPSPASNDFGKISWQTLLEALKLLKTCADLKMTSMSPEIIEQFRTECSTLYPLAAVFFTPDNWESHRKACIEETANTSVDGACPKIDISVANAHVDVKNTTRGDIVDDVADQLESISLKKSVNGQEPPKQQQQQSNKSKRGKKGANAATAVIAKV